MKKKFVSSRSYNMSRIRAKDTKPEVIFRKLLFSMGYRYRLHANDIVGKPDVVFRAKRKVIFINGCFWHRHKGCKFATIPKSNTDFWEQKFIKNIERDRFVIQELIRTGWAYLIIWECEIKNKIHLMDKIHNFL